jgi:hypothetical protein
MPRLTRLGALLVAALAAGAARAGDDAIPLGSDAPDHTFARAGYPNTVSACAQPGRTPDYCGYYVGGGCVRHGGPPGPLEGVYGYDYCCGPCFCHHVILNFCARYQGGIGAYKTDGPHVPNVFALKLPEPGPRPGCKGCGHEHE